MASVGIFKQLGIVCAISLLLLPTLFVSWLLCLPYRSFCPSYTSLQLVPSAPISSLTIVARWPSGCAPTPDLRGHLGLPTGRGVSLGGPNTSHDAWRSLSASRSNSFRMTFAVRSKSGMRTCDNWDMRSRRSFIGSGINSSRSVLLMARPAGSVGIVGNWYVADIGVRGASGLGVRDPSGEGVRDTEGERVSSGADNLRRRPLDFSFPFRVSGVGSRVSAGGDITALLGAATVAALVSAGEASSTSDIGAAHLAPPAPGATYVAVSAE
ncbi:hypothetical protein B0H14DRAFT_3472083 [Mycena olivaceomarginata]|nr:hypothetical protein B0H14DRAFT_3472083 [Mycena olivaceomarginata]